jgi:hypothetical protein
VVSEPNFFFADKRKGQRRGQKFLLADSRWRGSGDTLIPSSGIRAQFSVCRFQVKEKLEMLSVAE